MNKYCNLIKYKVILEDDKGNILSPPLSYVQMGKCL